MTEPKQKKTGLSLLWKIPLVTLGSVLGLMVVVLALISVILSPSKLTGLVEKFGTEYLVDAEVSAGHIELYVWTTFPNVELQIDSLSIKNTNQSVPAEYNTVASFDAFRGKLNVVDLIGGKITLADVELTRPNATYWEGADGVNSLSILPPTAPDSTDVDEGFDIPDFEFNSIKINGEGSLRYVSEPSAIDAAVMLDRIWLENAEMQPVYVLSFKGNIGEQALLPQSVTVAVDGAIGWQPSEPTKVELNDFNIQLDEIESTISAKVDLSDKPIIDALTAEVNNIPIQRINDFIAPEAPLFKSAATMSVTAQLKEPYIVDMDSFKYPQMHIEAILADAPLSAPGYYVELENIGAEVAVDVAQTLEASRVDLKRLQVKFPAADFKVNGVVTKIGSNPKVDGAFCGKVNFTRVDQRLWQLLGMKMRGTLNADVDFNVRLSDLTPHTFHNAKIAGKASLSRFMAYMPLDSIAAGAKNATMSFGTSRSINAGAETVDSLLSVTMMVDSAWAKLPELSARLAGLTLNLGIENRASSSDAATVTPMGGYLSIKSLRYQSESDSSRAVLRNLAGGVSLRRYKGVDKAPQIGAKLNVGRVMYFDGVSSMVSLNNADVFASAYYQKRQRRQSTRHPGLRRNIGRQQARRDSAMAVANSYERVDFGVDRSMVSLLRRWNVTGGVTAQRGRLVTPMFPLRTSLTGVNFAFNADSLMLKEMGLAVGQSDFALQGLVSNIQRSMGSAQGRTPLKMQLELTSDTINVNELTQALMRGASAMETQGMTDENIEEISDSLLASADTLPMLAPVIPMNVAAEFTFNARNIVYSNLLLHDFKGELHVANGSANLRDLHASSPELGSVDLNMLYYAPTRKDVNFAMGLDLNRFNIGKISDVLPALDTIMPMMNTLAGVVDLKLTATTPADSMLNVNLSGAKGLLTIEGDSLTLIDPETYKTVSKWLLFKDKNRNLIDHIGVQVVLDEQELSVYPFMFDFDRYRLGVMGHNDLDLNLDYHISIMKSPLPFRFGINVSGTTDDMKIRIGKARFKEEMAAQSLELSDSVRLNLAKEIRDVVTRGTRAARMGPLKITRPKRIESINIETDTISAAESQFLRQEGLISTSH